MNQSKRPQRKYTAEFKADVLRLVANGEPIMAVAPKMGISDSLIHAWRKANGKGKRKPIKLFNKKSTAYVGNCGKARWSARS